MTAFRFDEVAPGVHRLGTRYLNWYLIVDGGRVTVLDSGVPGYQRQLPHALAALGLEASSIEAVLITHHHPDHMGGASSLARSGVTVRAHAGDVPYIKGDKRLLLLGVARFLWRPWYMGYIGHLVRHGVLRPGSVADVMPFDDGEILDVPGKPRVIHVPGHTPGSCTLLLEDRGVLLSGDALVTLDTARGVAQPCILTGPVTADATQALASLDRLAGVKAEVMLPGHGESWHGDVADAVAQARSYRP